MAIQRHNNLATTLDDVQARIDQAKPNAVVEIAAGTLRGCLVIRRPITLRGRGCDVTAIDGWGRGPVIAVDLEDGEVRIEDMTICGGRAGRGAGILVANGARTIVLGCLVERNTARSGRGGGIAVDRGELVVFESTLRENRAQMGGALHVADGAKATVEACILANNLAVRGGAIAIVGDAEAQIATSRLLHNRAEIEGHHLYTHGTPSRFSRVAITNTMLGASDPAGIAIFNHKKFRASVILEDSTIPREFLPTQVVG